MAGKQGKQATSQTVKYFKTSPTKLFAKPVRKQLSNLFFLKKLDPRIRGNALY